MRRKIIELNELANHAKTLRGAGKKLVVWEFATRELAFGDWKLLDMKLSEPPPARFFVPKTNEEIVVTGICVGDYGRDLVGHSTFSSLFEQILELPYEARFRLSSRWARGALEAAPSSAASSAISPRARGPRPSSSRRGRRPWRPRD